MNRLERITAILLLLQSRKKITAQQLADRFDTSVRTIYRDVRVLEEAGVPVGAEAGLGYYILDGYNLPPVLFTREEAGAMLTAEKLLRKLGDVSLNREFTSAMDKIRAVLRSNDKDYVEKLEQSISVFTSRPLVDTSVFPNKFISMIQQALVNECVMEMEYYAHYTEEVSKRKIEPIGLCYINGGWHLFAWCRLRKAVRDFRPDRIKNMRVLDEHYIKNKLPALEKVAEDFYRPKTPLKVVIHMDKSLAKHSSDMKHYLGLVEESDKGAYHEVIFNPYSLTDFARWILHWGNKVKIIEPSELTREMKRLSQELQNHYN